SARGKCAPSCNSRDILNDQGYFRIRNHHHVCRHRCVLRNGSCNTATCMREIGMLTKPDWTETPLEEKKRMIREMIALEMTAEKISKAYENSTRNAVIGFCRRHNIKLVGR